MDGMQRPNLRFAALNAARKKLENDKKFKRCAKCGNPTRDRLCFKCQKSLENELGIELPPPDKSP